MKFCMSWYDYCNRFMDVCIVKGFVCFVELCKKVSSKLFDRTGVIWKAKYSSFLKPAKLLLLFLYSSIR